MERTPLAGPSETDPGSGDAHEDIAGAAPATHAATTTQIKSAHLYVGHYAEILGVDLPVGA